MSLSISRITQGDLDSVSRLHLDSWQVAYRGLLPQQMLDSLTLEQKKASWQKILANKKLHTLKATKQGQIKGIACYGPCRDKGSSPDQGEIILIYLQSDCFRQGIGSQLMRQVIKDLTAHDFTSASLWVLKSNLNAIDFYKKLGFQEADQSKNAVFFGFEIEEIRMSRLLRS